MVEASENAIISGNGLINPSAHISQNNKFHDSVTDRGNYADSNQISGNDNSSYALHWYLVFLL